MRTSAAIAPAPVAPVPVGPPAGVSQAGRPTRTPDTARSGGPRPLWVIGLVLGLVVVLGSAVAAVSAGRRAASLTTMLNRTEPLATAAQNLYAALSQADASAASAFLAGGSESSADREAYAADIAAAAGALGTAAAVADVSESDRTALGRLATQLPVYTALVATARANNELGFPVGAAYLREASNLLRTVLLPAAQALYAGQSQAVADAQAEGDSFPFAGVLLGGLILLALLIGQFLLSRRTRRRLSLGVLIALVATLAWVVWLALAGAAAAHRLDRSIAEGSQPLNAVVQARILAQQGRTDETLYLIARGSGDANEKAFTSQSGQLTALLTAPTLADSPTADSLRLAPLAATWIGTHQKLVATATGGDYPGAVTLGTTTSATQFAALDTALRTAVDDFRQVLRDQAGAASSAVGGLAAAIAALAVLALVAVGAGLWPRLREYQ